MSLMLMGRKVGMTRVFNEAGTSLPVTVISLGPCVVTQVKTAANDGYSAVQIGYDDVKARNSTMPVIGHDGKAGASPKRFHREFRVSEADAAKFTLGQELTAADFEKSAFVDVCSTSKGKGFQGTMKRWGFKGMCASHGTERKHRSPGSIGARANDRGRGNNKKGIKMSGQMGNTIVTIRSLPVVKLDVAQGLLLIKGSVPGPNGGMVEVRSPVRLYRSKARKQAEALKG
jgi:large subunit ribosomal protein L3